MIDPWLVFVIANVADQQRAALVERLIPAALPGPTSLRLTFTAIDIDRQLTRQAIADEQVMRDAVSLGLTADALAGFPALQRLFNGLSEDVKATIFQTTSQCPTKSQ